MGKNFLSLLVLFIVWLGIHYKLFNGELFIGGDNVQYFHWTAYHIENIIRGVYPLWNPFHAWGSVDNFDMRFLGEFNPIFLFMAFWVAAGNDMYWTFFIIMVLYFWLGCLGFYALSRQVLGGHHWALLAYTCLLFSSLRIPVMDQVVNLILFVPAVWFFVFLLGFVRAESAKDRLKNSTGIVFTLMIIASSYIPVFFVIIFLCFTVACLIIAPHWLMKGLKSMGAFARERSALVLIYLISLALACIPVLFWYQEANGPEYVLQVERSNQGESIATAAIEKMGGLAKQTSFEELFSDFDTGVNYVVYVPVMVFILALLSIFNRARRPQVLILLIGVFIFWIALTNVTPLHKFLYDHIFIFRMYRNYLFFWPVIVALVILFVSGESKEFLTRPLRTRRDKIIDAASVILIHAAFYSFLLTLDNVPVTSFATVILSMIWVFLRIVSGVRISDLTFVSGLVIIVLLQPMRVLQNYESMCSKSKPEHRLHKPQFVYQRPIFGSGYNESHGFHHRTKLPLDDSGFVDSGFAGTRASSELHANTDHYNLSDYVREKFLAYDRAVLMDPVNFDWPEIEHHLRLPINEAYVSDPEATKNSRPEEFAAIDAMSYEQMKEFLQVTAFDLNHIKIETNFPWSKFFVYNDSFHSGWQATIDGQKAHIYQANVAFKGLWVEPGKHWIEFKFYPGRHVFFLFLTLYFLGCCVALILLWAWPLKKVRV